MKPRTAFRIFLVVTTALALGAVTSPVAHAAVPRCLGVKATIVGTARADVIKGTARADVIVGLGGSDTIKGLGGNDRICGGPGKDTLVGGAGYDVLFGDIGNDVLGGGAGDDVLLGGSGNDAFNGGLGIGDLASFFFASAGVQVDLSAGTATGEGTDTLTGIEDLEGSRYDDTLTGDDGLNYILPGEGNDAVDGGGGLNDWVDYFYSASAVVVDLTAGSATGQGTDTLTGIEEVYGSQHNDTITGDAGPNALLGGAGDDTISGAAGDDTLDGGDGNDTLDGGDGTDTVDGGAGTDTCVNGEDVSNCEA